MRITNHNGRAGKHGVYSAKHNDRKFDMDKAEHIDQDRTSLNRYWQRDQEASSFEAPASSQALGFSDTLKAPYRL